MASILREGAAIVRGNRMKPMLPKLFDPSQPPGGPIPTSVLKRAIADLVHAEYEKALSERR